MPPLPSGLTPVQAGRLGLWLLSRRSYRQARRRDAGKVRVWPYNRFSGRVCALVAPWAIADYPGAERWLAQLCGVGQRTVEMWLYGKGRDIPVAHAGRVADALEARAAQERALAAELRAQAEVVSRNRAFRKSGNFARGAATVFPESPKA